MGYTLDDLLNLKDEIIEILFDAQLKIDDVDDLVSNEKIHIGMLIAGVADKEYEDMYLSLLKVSHFIENMISKWEKFDFTEFMAIKLRNLIQENFECTRKEKRFQLSWFREQLKRSDNKYLIDLEWESDGHVHHVSVDLESMEIVTSKVIANEK